MSELLEYGRKRITVLINLSLEKLRSLDADALLIGAVKIRQYHLFVKGNLLSNFIARRAASAIVSISSLFSRQ